MTTDDAIKKLSKRMILLGLFMSVCSLYFRSVSVTLGVVVGFLLAVGNFWLIQRTVGGLLARKRSSMTGVYVVKLGIILLVLYFWIGIVGLNPLAIMVGFSVLAVVTTTSGASVLTESLNEDDGTALDVESTDG